ncbi:MAG: DUF349 domain-containing protein [Bacteroidales bacterium]|nr:DUF349 domain-containing protein [Bacteroidales bacterium]
MDNQDQNTVNSVEENVVNSTEQETNHVVENATEITSEITPEATVEVAEVAVTNEASEEASRKNYSEEILSVEHEHDEESEEEEIHESIDELTVHYSKMNRQELMDEIKSLANSENIQQMKLRASLIRNSFKLLTTEAINLSKEKFLADGGVEEDFKFEDDEIAVEFNKYYSLYREKRQQYLELQERTKLENVAKKNAILDELRALLSSEEGLKETYDKFNLIQEKWKIVGQVPRTEVNGLWQNYHFLIEKFYDKVKINRELRDLDLKKNLDAKIELCERVEGLILEPSINKSFKALQEIHQQWKSIGSVPMDKNEEIWERFKIASDKINKLRQDYYETMKVELESNLLAKIALCEKAEEIIQKNNETPKDWNDSTNEMNDMLKLWKSIGSVPQKDNEVIWTRFKSCLDNFFAGKKEIFNKLKEEQDINYNKKVEICVKAEAISERTDWRSATQELLGLQKEWKEIGYVPKKLSDKLWGRFRSACDKFFENKSAFYVDNRAKETENLAKKEDLIKQVIEFQFGDNKEENLNAIKDFQRQWSEIQYVPLAEKERLQKEFRGAINAHFEKLEIDVRQFQLSTYKERVFQGGGDDRSFSKEKRFLQDKIQKLKEDVNLWENNLGFLANSKQADILKNEFEKKMENARKEIALNEAKLKMIDSPSATEIK